MSQFKAKMHLILFLASVHSSIYPFIRPSICLFLIRLMNGSDVDMAWWWRSSWTLLVHLGCVCLFVCLSIRSFVSLRPSLRWSLTLSVNDKFSIWWFWVCFYNVCSHCHFRDMPVVWWATLPYWYCSKNVSGYLDATPDLLLLFQQKLLMVQYRYGSLELTMCLVNCIPCYHTCTKCCIHSENYSTMLRQMCLEKGELQTATYSCNVKFL